MNIKDIVNRDLVNLTNCEHEPIHIPGSIQPHGFLIGIKQDGIIDFCTGNIGGFIGYTHEQVLGKSFEQVFGYDQSDALNKYISVGSSFATPFLMNAFDQRFTCALHTSNDIHVLEIEHDSKDVHTISEIYAQTKQFVSYLEQVSSLQRLCQAIADETRAITGYDRVMIYRFDADYNGEVFAESKVEEAEPFMGLHYPHTDIPSQARELYIKNLLRLIVDVNYTPVPIYTIDNGSAKNLDLSHSTLRSVSPIHVQYLNNMGVGATLTISLLHEGRLWGLIACHHYGYKYIDRYTRIAAQLQGHFLTSQIKVRELAEEYDVSKVVNRSLERMLDVLSSPDAKSMLALVDQEDLMLLANATGVVIVLDDEIHSSGKIPPTEEIQKLANWLQTYSTQGELITDKLSAIYPDATRWCEAAAGIIYHSLGSGANNCIIWCRAQELQEVTWAGDPQKAIIKDEKGLSPRRSFEGWKEIKKCQSLAWRKPETASAGNFANALQKHVYTLFLAREESKYRHLSEKLKEANAELENVNWISTHDLKEPLRKIQIFASRILDEEEGTSDMILNSVKRMNDSARRMQHLLTDIMSYSRVSHMQDNFSIIDLDKVVGDVVEELRSEITDAKGTVHFVDLPQVDGIVFLINQLFVNLIRNALKFTRPGVSPEINIKYHGIVPLPTAPDATAPFKKITIADNGIGFDNKHSESIFNVFTRLHKVNEYAGSGVGLALCRKIMKNHEGYIFAEGDAATGATFSLFFPEVREV